MSAAALDSSQSSSGYEDGLGRRVLAFDRESGTLLERLALRPELCVFEKTLNERLAVVAGLDDEHFAKPRAIEHLVNGHLIVISEFAGGRRLSDIIDGAAEYGIVAGLDAGLGLLLELLPAIARLHDAGLVHGALAPGRVKITPDAQILLLDAIYAEPLERLQLARKRLWMELRLAFPPTAGSARFDKGADLSQAAMVAAALMVGRPLRDDEYPDGIAALRQEILEIASIRGSKPFADAVDKFFAAALPLAGRKPVASADEAAIDLRKLVRKELGINTCRTALVEFLQQVETADAEQVVTEGLQRDARAKQDGERLARQQAEAERIAREKAEAERVAREKAEAERRERERLEAERTAREKAEAQRREDERLEAERIAHEKAEAERREFERLEAERIAHEKAEAQRREFERLEAERIARKKAEAERREHQRLEAERIARAQAEAERREREQLQAERIAREKAEAERRERERLEAERIAREEAERRERARLEAERIARAKAEADRLAREKAQAERMAREKAEAERIAREKAEAERRERERLEAERIAREKVEAARREQERLEAERIARAKAEAERLERERIDAERIAREKAEVEKRAREKIEAGRRERERLEAERIAREKAEAEKRERDRADRERLAKEARQRADQARLEAERLERERIEAEQLDRERAAQAARERAERQRLEAERLEREAREREAEEARERAERERLERDRSARERLIREERERSEHNGRLEQERFAAEALAAEQAARETQPPPAERSAQWLVNPKHAAAFKPPVADAPTPPPTARPYPIYVPPAEPAAWTADVPALPAPIQITPFAGGTATSPPSTIPTIAAPPASSPSIRLKESRPSPAEAHARADRRHERQEPEGLFAADSYVPISTPADPRPIPWKLIAAGVGLIAVAYGVSQMYSPTTGAPAVAGAKRAVTQEAPPTEAPLAAAGEIAVKTDPTGLKVLLDGRPAGETPITLKNVSTGRHVVTLIGNGGTLKRTVRVEAGVGATVDVTVFSGFVKISAPFAIEIAENGKVIGTSDDAVILGPGRHSLHLSNKELGYAATQQVEVQPGETTPLNLDPRARANINAAPWAEVWVDGEKAGETPLANVPIRLGVREIVFKNPQFPDRKIVTTIKAGSSETIAVDFNKDK
jgi:hypothetical protein